MFRAGVAESGEGGEEILGLLADLLARRAAAELDGRGVAVVFGAGEAQGLLPAVLAHEFRQALVEHPDRVAGDLRGLAVAAQRVLEVAELLVRAQVRVDAE